MEPLIKQLLVMLLLQQLLPECLPILISAPCLSAPCLPQPGFAYVCHPSRQEIDREALAKDRRRRKACAGITRTITPAH